jgi:hypothetical protein
VPVTVNATRTGYNGPISLRLEGLPAGVTASTATLAEGENSAVFTLAAPAGATPAWGQLRVVGSAEVGGKRVERVAAGAERYQPPLTTTPKDMRTRTTELLLVATGPAPPFTLSATPTPAVVKVGGKVELTVKLNRKEGTKDNVAIMALALPKGIKAADLTLKAGTNEGKLTLTADKSVKSGTARLILQGSAQKLVVAAPATELTIQPAK